MSANTLRSQLSQPSGAGAGAGADKQARGAAQGHADLTALASIPPCELSGPSRWAIASLIYQGHQMTCFQSYSAEPGEDPWRIWSEALAKRRPDHNGRIDLETWKTSWRTLYTTIARSVE